MTNNPAKYHGLRGYGITVTGRVPLFAPITLENKTYLEAKEENGAFVRYGRWRFREHRCNP